MSRRTLGKPAASGLAAFYFIAFIVCFLVFFAKRSWGYLVAAVCWLMIGIYCLVRKDDDL